MTVQYGSLREKIAAESAARRARYDLFEGAWDSAHAAGNIAVDAIKGKIAPMIVREHANMLDDNSPVKRQWIVEGGPCGFAWVKVRPANCSFVQWAKKTGKVRRERADYDGGFTVLWNPLQTQSMAMQEAYCRAFAETIRNWTGVNAYVQSRLD